MNAHCGRSWLALSLLASAACAAAPPARVAPAPAVSAASLPTKTLPGHSRLPAPVRDALSARMFRHGEQMMLLMASIVLLEYDAAHEIALQIAAEPPLGRPKADEQGTLNALLPPAFFVHQEQLAERARTIVAAAIERDDTKLVAGLSALTESCVGCHAAFLHDEPDERRDEEPGFPRSPDEPGAPREPGESGQVPEARGAFQAL